MRVVPARSGVARVIDAGNSGSSLTVALTSSDREVLVKTTLTATCSCVITGAVVGERVRVVFELTQDATGGRGFDFATAALKPNGGLGLSSASNKVDALIVYSTDGFSSRILVENIIHDLRVSSGTTDTFDVATAQNLKTGGDGAKANGWLVRNTANATTMDVNTSNAGYMTISPNSTNSGIAAASITGPYAYKLFTGDFDIETAVVDNADAPNEQAGLLVSSNSNEALHIYIINYFSTVQNVASRSSNGTTEATVGTDVVSSQQRFRVTRVGDVFTFYRKASAGDAWTNHGSVSRSDLGSSVRIGLYAAPANTSANYTARFEQFQVN